jgi:glycosyltransferase involved in cell wall biosynthesis
MKPAAPFRGCGDAAPRLLFVVNADWFFVSHRLALAVACLRAGYDVALCAGESGARAQIEALGIRFFALPIDRGGTHPLRDALTLGALVAVYREFRPNLVHHVTIKPVLYGSLAARLVGVDGVVNAVSGLGYAFIPRPADLRRHKALRGALRAAYRGALAGRRTRVIFQNEDDRESFVRAGLVEANRTKLIRGSGVDLEAFKPAPLPSGDFVALVPSRLLWDKGVGEFVEAARRLKASYSRARFVLLGRIDPGNPAAIPEGEVRRWVEEGVVEWWEARQHADMPEMYGRAHVVVLPSYREGLPLALAEAAAAGRAVITTDVPGCRDTILDAETGWLIKPRDADSLVAALDAAMTNLTRLREMGARARTFAEARFGVEGVLRATQETYRELLKGSGSNAPATWPPTNIPHT